MPRIGTCSARPSSVRRMSSSPRTSSSGRKGELARRLLPQDLDFQGCAEFMAFAVDVDPAVAVDALDGMLGRWSARTSNASWPRLLSWMDRRGWGEVSQVLDRYRGYVADA